MLWIMGYGGEQWYMCGKFNDQTEQAEPEQLLDMGPD